ncbi:ABC transporter permease, partial [Micromonospora sp. ATA32]|nr:ABC transporter permease [Micromonospora sp. ATA32]
RVDLPATAVALDAAAAPGVVRLADRLGDQPAGELLDRMVKARGAPAGVALPATARRLTGIVRTPVEGALRPHMIEVSALVTSAQGVAWRLPLASAGSDGGPVPFTLDLPDSGGSPLRLAGFEADGGEAAGSTYRLQIGGLRLTDLAGVEQPVELTGTWAMVDPAHDEPVPTSA